jgi:dipeptidase E
MNGKVIAIGGGSVYAPCKPGTTLAIDKEAVRIAREGFSVERKVQVLFIPTASGDDIEYCHGAYVQFGLQLGCDYKYLRLLKERNTWASIVRKIKWADIIYVGGGNTRNMMNVWCDRGVDELLVCAYKQGKVMMGLSAGAICWFDSGLSDSEKAPDKPDWQPCFVSGLGLLPFSCCPHLDSEVWRREHLKSFGTTQPLIALEDNCAIEVVNGNYRIITSQRDSCAYLYTGAARKRIPKVATFQPLSSLIL